MTTLDDDLTGGTDAPPPPGLVDRIAEVERRLGGIPLPTEWHGHDGIWHRPLFDATPYGRALADADEDVIRAAGLWGQRRLHLDDEFTPARVAHYRLVKAIAERKGLRWTLVEAETAARTCLVGDPGLQSEESCLLAICAAERLPAAELPRLRDLLTRVRSWACDSTALYGPVRKRFRKRFDALIDGPPGQWRGLPPSLLHAGDAFGPTVRAEFGAALDAPGVPALLVHAAMSAGPRPRERWSAEARRLLAAAEDGPAVVRRLLERTLSHRETTHVAADYDGNEYTAHSWLHETTAQLVRGLVQIVHTLDEPWVTPLLGNLLLHAGGGLGGSVASPRDLVVTNAAVAALAERDDAVPQLARAQARIKHKAALKGITAALEAAARRTGVTVGELAEAAVPTYGLDDAGRRTAVLGDHRAVLSVASFGSVTLSFTAASGRSLASVPAAVRAGHADALADLRAEVKDIKRTVSAERIRLENLMAENRTWSFDRWAQCYRDHALVKDLVRNLLWRVETADGERTGRLTDDGSLVDVDGTVLPAGDRVRLWHPVLAEPAEVHAWRGHLMSRQLRQPFKQAFREIYRLTPAEIESGDYSNRFAAHVLKAPQAQALMRVRGWTGNSLGYWDGGSEGRVEKTFGEWRAEFWFDLIEQTADGYGTPSLASSDQVRFCRLADDGWQRRPSAEVPTLLFSEAMRDVDLFVGVTSISADPTWVTRGERDHLAYWQRVSFGELSESAETRRAALERLVPMLRIADLCTLTDRFLQVRGSMRSYKIHLGSGNILMSPDDEYLCIVPSRDSRDPKVYLPFEDDGGMLSVILSKAFLLADDAAITDPDIVGQIRAR